jgi:hypothetical protein
MRKLLPLVVAASLVGHSAFGQPSPPPPNQQSPVNTFCWNGSAVVMCGTGASSGPVQIMPGQRTMVTLDTKTVTTGGTAVVAIAAGNRTGGGWLFNPETATAPLCINEIGTASGTSSAGDTTCIGAGRPYNVTPAAGAVSVVSSDSSHPFSGYGLK